MLFRSPNVTIDRSMTLWAQWDALSFSVVLDAGEGEIFADTATKTYKYDSLLSAFPLG